MGSRSTAATRSRDALLAGVGAWVRAAREQRGLSRRALSERCGVSERFLSELESGVGNISIARLAEVAKALGTSASVVLATAEGAASYGASSALAVPRGALVALVGMRGAGKSAIGRRLAEQLGVPFFEQDQLVERAAGLSLPDIFSLHGEAYYRRLAREALARFLSETQAGVLPTGGGIVTHREAHRLLPKRRVTLWVRAAPAGPSQRGLPPGGTPPAAARSLGGSDPRRGARETLRPPGRALPPHRRRRSSLSQELRSARRRAHRRHRQPSRSGRPLAGARGHHRGPRQALGATSRRNDASREAAGAHCPVRRSARRKRRRCLRPRGERGERAAARGAELPVPQRRQPAAGHLQRLGLAPLPASRRGSGARGALPGRGRKMRLPGLRRAADSGRPARLEARAVEELVARHLPVNCGGRRAL